MQPSSMHQRKIKEATKNGLKMRKFLRFFTFFAVQKTPLSISSCIFLLSCINRPFLPYFICSNEYLGDDENASEEVFTWVVLLQTKSRFHLSISAWNHLSLFWYRRTAQTVLLGTYIIFFYLNKRPYM